MSLVDAFFRMAYRLAYQLARVYWRVVRPDNHGALVMIWHEEQVLIIKNSYVRYFSLPGGNLRPGETAGQAAKRELKEEIHLDVSADQLQVALDHVHCWEGRQDHVVIFELRVKAKPSIEVDHREVISAEWLTPAEALGRELFPPLRPLIQQRLGEPAALGGPA